MAYPNEVKEYARELFLTDDGNGSHKYTKTGIAEEIPKKFRELEKNPDESTIRTWINSKDKITKKSWLDLWQNGQRAGYEAVNAEMEEKLDAEEKIELKVDAITRARANRAIKLGELVDTKIENKEPLKNIDLKTLQTSELIFNNLNLESTLDDNTPSGFDDLAKAINISRQKAEKADEEGN